jgi:hypothetical protein
LKSPAYVGIAGAIDLAGWKKRIVKLRADWQMVKPVFVLAHLRNMLNMLHMIRLDYLSCVLTVLATVLIGKKLWQGWVVAGINSAVVSVIGIRTAQFGFVPANLLCIALYTSNLFNWRFRSEPSSGTKDVTIEP